jgi:hypothetical protein
MDLEEVSFAKPAGTDCDQLKLVVGSVDEEFEERTDGNSNKICVVDGFVESIETNGEVAKIQLVEEPEFRTSLINIKIEKLKLNGTAMSNTYSKAYADAIISFNQSNQTSYTKYTVATLTKYNGSTQISDLHFYKSNGDELVSSLTAGEQISKDDTFTIDNLSDSERITRMVYTVKRGNDTQIVDVNYSDYPDYFKTNNDDLRVYANGKDKDSD